MTRPKLVQASFASSVSEKKEKHSQHLIRQTKKPLACFWWCILRKKLTKKWQQLWWFWGVAPAKNTGKPDGFREGLKTQNGFPSVKNEGKFFAAWTCETRALGNPPNYENVIIQLENMRKTISIATVALSFCG